MTLEDLIYTRLSDPDGPAAKLARYGEAPAIFYQAAPEDTAAGWDGNANILVSTIPWICRLTRSASPAAS